MKGLKGLIRVIDNISKWSGQVIAPLAFIYMGILIYEVLVRYLFNNPTNWAHELSTFIFGAQFMLGGAYCLWRGSMVNVDILHERLPFRAKSIIDTILFICPLIICIIMIWKGGNAFLYSFAKLEHTNTVFGPPLYPLRGIIPLAAIMLLIQAFAKFLRDLYAAITGRTLNA